MGYLDTKEKINIFMDWIYNKPLSKYSIAYWIYRYKFRKFIKDFRYCNPDFVTLWHIVSFIRLLKITYFYRYRRDSELFCIDDFPEENAYSSGFFLYENDYSIEIRLNRLDKQISIRIIDTLQSKSRNVFSKMDFTDNTLELKSIHDRFQYDYLNELITHKVSDILVYYFKHY